jgi:hypothetical protein
MGYNTMKLTESKLRQIIKEEVAGMLTERKDFATVVRDTTNGLRSVSPYPMDEPAGVDPERRLGNGEYGIQRGWIILRDGPDLKSISPRQTKPWTTGDWNDIRAALAANGWTEIDQTDPHQRVRSLPTPQD